MKKLLFILAFTFTTASCFADISVKDFGARGDGVTDDTKAFTAALEAAAKNGGGIVKAPAGTYCIKGNLNIPTAVTLEGTWRAPRTWGGKPTETEKNGAIGSTLLAYAGRGSNEGKPFINLCTSSTIKGFGIYYPEADQKTVPPIPYPPCISNTGSVDNASVIDCNLLNPYEGIKFVNAGRFYISNVQGYPIWRGIYVDACYDIGRIENVHYWPFGIVYVADDPYCEWINKNGVAFEFARTDWQYMSNTFCFGYGVGYKFSKSQNGDCNGSFTTIGADSCRRSILVESIQPYGLLITNGEFVGRWSSTDSVAIEITEDVSGRIGLTNCAFWGPLDKCIIQNAKASILCANGCNFQMWDINDTNSPALDLIKGKATITGCSFAESKLGVSVGKQMGTTLITSNLAESGLKVKNNGTPYLQMLANEEPKPELNRTQRKSYKLNLGLAGDSVYIKNFNHKESSTPEWGDNGMKRWSKGISTIVLPVIEKMKYHFVMDVNVPQYALDDTAGIYINGKCVSKITKAGLYKLKGDFICTSDKAELEIKCKMWIPAEKLGLADYRELGIGVKSITLQMEGANWAPMNANDY